MMYPLGAARQLGGMGMTPAGGSEVTYETPSYEHALGSGNRYLSYFEGKLSTSGEAPMWGIISSTLSGGYACDGLFANTWGYTNNVVAVADEWMEFDFTGLASPTYKMEAFKLHFSGALVSGPVFKSKLLINGVWVDASANFNLAESAEQEIIQTVTDGLTKWRLYGVSGNSSWDVYWQEIEFKIGGQL